MAIFKDKAEYQAWVDSEEWYQTMDLPSGIRVKGKVPTQMRKPLLDEIDFKGKSFLDVGCNSGQYCFMAKERGAMEVVGIDIDTKRLAQAKVLALNEGLDVSFEEKNILEGDMLKPYDIVFCIAVLTEIQDIFGAIEKLKRVIGKYALIELSLAKPIAYLSYSKRWLKGYPNLSRRTAVAELRKIRGEKWVVDPSLDVLRAVFGEEFKLTRKEGGIRYDLVEVVRVKA